MPRRLSAVPLWVLLVFAASCASNRVATGGAAVFMAVPLSATEMEIEYSGASIPAYQRAYMALCRCAELALDNGFRYLQIHDRKRLGPGDARWKVRLFHAPPAGAVLLDVAAPTWADDPPGDGVLDARSFAAACHDRSRTDSAGS